MNDDTATAREYYRKQEALFGDGKGNDGLYYLEQVDNDLREQGRYRIALKREFNSRYSDFAPVYVPGIRPGFYWLLRANPIREKRE